MVYKTNIMSHDSSSKKIILAESSQNVTLWTTKDDNGIYIDIHLSGIIWQMEFFLWADDILQATIEWMVRNDNAYSWEVRCNLTISTQGYILAESQEKNVSFCIFLKFESPVYFRWPWRHYPSYLQKIEKN